MRINSFHGLNFKSFRDTGEIEFSAGFNVVVGKNDSGKSALIEMVGLRATSKPHRSLETAPWRNAVIDPVCRITAKYSLTASDLNRNLVGVGGLIVPSGGSNETDLVNKFTAATTNDGVLTVSWNDSSPSVAWLEEFPARENGNNFVLENADHPGGVRWVVNPRANHSGQYGIFIAQQIRESIYAFRAERLKLGEGGAQGHENLQPDASNLPEVLQQLIASNPKRFGRLLVHVRRVFPDIGDITVPTIPGTNSAQIRIWNSWENNERDDLAIPLSESGTGIGQVLAMLYVVVTSDSPRIILIDEPQSFLHPGAVRVLLDILRSYPQHQYLITTHSPDVISGSDADALFLVKKEVGVSRVERIEKKAQSTWRIFLAEVGVRLSDVFGANAVLWVEGKTEETCFPQIVSALTDIKLGAIQILGVVSTDEFHSKRARRVFEIYSRISGGTSVLPPAIGFLFDLEGRSELERADLTRASKGTVSWLPRRMFENYLLDPSAICQVLNLEDANHGMRFDEATISDWIKDNSLNFVDNKSLRFPDEGWFVWVDGAKLLIEAFSSITESRVQYEKVRHGVMLTKILIERRAPQMVSLAGLLAELLRTTAAA